MRITLFTMMVSSIVLLSMGSQATVSTNRNYQGVTDFIHKLAQNYPQTTSLFTLGFSNTGIAIEGIKIGNGSVRNMLVATHHGNEYGSTELALHFAEDVARTPIVDHTMYVIPVLNIDGYNARQRWERINGQSIDPNRDYPGPCGTEGPFHSNSTKALADFIGKEGIIASATIHTFWPAAVFPWGLSSHDLDTPYTPIFMNMVNVATSASHYQKGNATDVIYAADGTYEDFAFWKYGIWSILFEVGNSHSPDIKGLNQLVQENVPGLRQMFEMAPKTLAPDHEFKGQCSAFMRTMDLHIE